MREQIPSEMWEELNSLYLFIGSKEAREVFASSTYQFYKRVLEGSHQFIGLTDATMTHGEGWDFCQLGKYIERADRTSRILDVKYHILLPSGERVGGNVDTIQWMAVLRSCSALEAYCKIYVGQVAPWKVAEFLILHEAFPRALRFCVRRLDAALHRISGTPEERFSNESERLSGQLRSDLDYSTISEIFGYGLHQYLDRLQLRLMQINDALHETYCQDAAQWQAQTQKQSGGGSQSQSPVGRRRVRERVRLGLVTQGRDGSPEPLPDCLGSRFVCDSATCCLAGLPDNSGTGSGEPSLPLYTGDEVVTINC